MEKRKLAPLDESSSRQIWVGWGSGVVCLALAYLVGGVFFPYLLLFIGITVAARGHLPNLFAKHIEEQLIAGTPYRRTESVKAWVVALLACAVLAAVASWIHITIAPRKPDVAQMIIDAVKKMIEQQKPTVIIEPRPYALERPLVVVSSVRFYLQENVLSGHLEALNESNVPANSVTLKWRTGAQSEPLNLNVMPPLVRFPGDSNGALAPHQGFGATTRNHILPMAVIPDLKLGKGRAYIYGIIDYQDTLGKDHFQTGFCYRAPVQDFSGDSEPCPQGNFIR